MEGGDAGEDLLFPGVAGGGLVAAAVVVCDEEVEAGGGWGGEEGDLVEEVLGGFGEVVAVDCPRKVQ